MFNDDKGQNREQVQLIQYLCDPCYRNETLLCKTPNGDIAEYIESFRLKFEAQMV